MNILFMLSLVAVAVLVVRQYRTSRDSTELRNRIRELDGSVLALQRVRRGHPFTDTGRGWWVWRVQWRDQASERTSYVLTTRDGIKDWRD